MNTVTQSRDLPTYRFFLLLWAAAVTVVTVIFYFELLPLPEDVAPVRAMEFSQGPAEPSGRNVSLPDNWRSFAQRPARTGLYRSRFDHSADSGRWAVYVPSYSGQITVAVNGVELTSGGFLSGELIADQGTPYFSTISPDILKRRDNEIAITLRPGGKLTGFLSEIYLGKAEELRSSYGWYHLRAVRLPVLVVFWQLLLAALLLLLWVSRRREEAALYCAIILLCSSIHGIPIFLPSSLALSNTVALLGYVTNFWQSVIGLLFSCSLAGRSLPLKTRTFLILPVFATLAFLILPQQIFHYIDVLVVVPFSLVMSGWIVYVLVDSAIRERRWDSTIILLSILGSCALAIHDTLIISNVTPDSNILHFRIVFILILPALSVVFLQRLIQSMNQVDDLVDTLEQRIEHKELQLRETFEQRQILEGRQTLDEERRRIMRDVHDGLGGQLMSIIAMSRLEESDLTDIESSARAALDDLRMVIGSMDVEDDITGMLGTFRERAEQQLALQNIQLEWKMIDIPAIEGLNPSGALNVLRILQEATTNSAKHSGADKVSIRFSLTTGTDPNLKIDIDDNGCGMDQVSTTGHGLRNMTSRARDLNGKIEISQLSPGTRVSLTMPVSPVPEP